MNEPIGKIPPQALDIEVIVLGALLLEKGQERHIGEIEPEIFYSTGHQLIFEAIKDLYIERNPIDLVTVNQMLSNKGQLEIIGGTFYLTKLTENLASAANTDYHIKILKQKHIARRLIEISDEAKAGAFSDHDPLKLASDVVRDMMLLQSGITNSRTTKIDKALDDLMSHIDSGKSGMGIKSVFPELNKALNGYQQSKAYFIAARPGMGKTAFILQEAVNMALNGLSVGFISLEMSTESLTVRMSSMNTGIDSQRIENNDLTESEIIQLQSQKIYSKNLLIDDLGAMTMVDIISFCHNTKHKLGLDALIIDYLQLIEGEGKQSTYDKISAAARGCKNIAKQLKIPVIALSQLSREVEKRPDKMPRLSDLLESGAIEAAADAVIFLYRPAYYKEHQDANGIPYPDGHTVVNIAKNRSGSTGTICLRFIPHTTSFDVATIEETAWEITL